MRAFEFLTEKWSKKYKSSINCANPKGFSQKAHCAGRKKNESVNENETPAPKKVGREFNHLEDLVFTEPNGALRAVDILKNLAQDASDVAIKWDGNPTVYWGRDEDGTFRMVGKNNWGREEGKSSSPQDLEQFILSRGKGEDWRAKFASDMAAMWPVFEAATPKDFRGYVYGDILFHPGKPYQGADGRITFTPNQTTYAVKGNSDIGRRLAKADVAVAAHQQYGYFGDKSSEPFTNPEIFVANPKLVVFGQTYVSYRPAVNADNLAKITKLANKYSSSINKILTPQPGLSDLQTIIYTFVSQQSRAKELSNINEDSFFQWLSSSKVSQQKQSKIAAISQANPSMFDAIFTLVRELMAAKDEVIRELDAAEGDITASTGGKPGGEGYVKGKDSVKLVPRDRWTPFRAD